MVKSVFVTIFMARSGSKFLRSLLNQHSDIHDFGEFFHDRDKKFPDDIDLFIGLGELLLSEYLARGVQFRYPRHFKETPEFIKLLETYPHRVKILLLKRRNKLKGAISQQNAEILKQSTGRAHLFKASKQKKMEPLRLDITRAINEAKQREILDNEYKNWATAQFDTFEIFYEDLFANCELVVNRVCKFLNLNPFKPETLRESNLVKVTSDNLSDAIQNFDELSRQVTIHEVEHWLKPDEELIPFLDNNKSPFMSKITKQNSIIPFLRKLRPNAHKNDFFFYRGQMKSGKNFTIKAEKLPLKTNSIFLENIWNNNSTHTSVLSAQNNAILESFNNGNNWKRHKINLEIQKSFTTSKGNHLLQGKSGLIHVFDKEWKKISETKTGDYSWHGSWSIDECTETGTIIYAEYPYCAEKVNVWRSVDQGNSWKVCFQEDGHAEHPKLGRIRHFHLVQKDNSNKGRWYLSSGDYLHQCRFWVSGDDGLTWKEVALSHVSGPGATDIPAEKHISFYRFTGMVQTQHALIWVTDDTFKGRGSRVCVMQKQKLGDIHVINGHCGNNEIRNFIQIDSRYALAVSEAKLDQQYAYMALIDYEDESIEALIPIKNLRGTKSNFMNGVSSKKADSSGHFFSRSDNIVLYPCPMTIRWKIDID